MAEIYYSQFTVENSLEPGDLLRFQRKVGGVWRDYCIDAVSQTGFFIQEYDIVDLVATPVQNLGPAAPAGKGYIILPTSWASYAPAAGHVDDAVVISIMDSGGTDDMQSFGMLLRLGATVYSPINAASTSWNVLANTDQLMIDASDITAGDGLLTIRIDYTLADI